METSTEPDSVRRPALVKTRLMMEVGLASLEDLDIVALVYCKLRFYNQLKPVNQCIDFKYSFEGKTCLTAQDLRHK